MEKSRMVCETPQTHNARRSRKHGVWLALLSLRATKKAKCVIASDSTPQARLRLKASNTRSPAQGLPVVLNTPAYRHMDPLSFTASIITVIATAAQVAKHLDELRKGLQHAPDALSSLINEVSDLRIVLEACDTAVKELYNISTAEDPTTPLADAAQILDRTRGYLEELDKLIGSCLGGYDDTASISKTARFRWLRVRGKVEKIQQSVRDTKQDLMVLIESQSVSALSGMQITVQDVSIGLKECHSASIEKMDDILAKLSDHMTQTKELRSMTEDLAEKFTEPSLSRTSSQTSTRPPSYHERDPMDEDAPSPSESTEYLRVRASCYRKTCRPWCSCRCHIRRAVRTPGLTKNFFGSLFVGYGGIPIITQPCNERQCRKRSSSRVVLSYQFPEWFWSKSLLLSFMTASVAGPELLIRVSNTIPHASETYQHCLDGNVAGLLRLFEKRIASPFDMDPNGASLLSNALRFDHFGVCHLLISEGADLYQEDHTGFSAYHNAWDGILFEALEPRFSKRKQALLELFPQDEGGLDERQFSRIHKSVLGIIGTKLKDELDISTSTIDDVDNLGRTPLWWACRRSDVNAARLLLEYGARCEPLGMRDGGSPLIAAAKVGNEKIMRLLLEHNANITAREETTRNSLQLASMVPSGTKCVELLLKAGAEVDYRDKDNLTALHHAISYGCIENAEVLLAAGADIEALCQDGWTALACAVFWNTHESIKLLLEHGANTLTKTEPGESLLHLAARYGDEVTLRILASRSLGLLDVNAKTVAGEDVHRIAKDRDQTPSWYAALEDLLTSIEYATKEKGSVAGARLAKLSMSMGIKKDIRPDKVEVVWVEEVPDYDSDTGHYEDALEQLIL